MWKLVIADDEPKIRRGLRKILDWSIYNIEIVGEAEDGELALQVVNEKQPDIMLLDINMPFINGLNLLERLRQTGFDGIVIIISGYDEFSYAQKALKLKVYDYVLKPVNKENLEKIISGAILKLEEKIKNSNYQIWIEKQLKRNIYDLKKKFFVDLLDNKLNKEEILNQIDYFKINLKSDTGILVAKINEKLNAEIIDKNWNKELMKYAVFNLLNDIFKSYNDKFIFEDSSENIVIIASINKIKDWINIADKVEMKILEYIKCRVLIEYNTSSSDILEIKSTYHNIIDKLNDKDKLSPIVLCAIKYIEDNYYLNDLSINKISNQLEVTSSYLSKLLKKETGLSFVDYLTNLRIKKAKCLMNDPAIKIYDVSELVGYNNQHYFCRAFKKVTGLSPTNYKKGIVE